MRAIDSLNAYIAEGHKSVDGWLLQPDMTLMACAGLSQDQLCDTGSIGEIGVYNGKSLILLSHLLRENEKAIGIDYFDADTMDQTWRNLRRLSPRSDSVTLHRANTLDLDEERLASILPSELSLRYLHVDGGHEYFEVLHDLLLFSAFLRLDAMLVVDDYHDREYPGVNLAVEHFCSRDRSEHGFVPFMEGLNKLFLCRKIYARTYQSSLIQMPIISQNARVSHGPGHAVLVPFSRFPMLPEDLRRAIDNPARFILSVTTTQEQVNQFARAFGSHEMELSMARAGKTNKDLL